MTVHSKPRIKYKFELIESTKAKKQKYRWRIMSCNGRIVASSELYAEKIGVTRVVNSLIEALERGSFSIGRWKKL
jgi:uncharacterized protein YegP (UPF0339 family)